MMMMKMSNVTLTSLIATIALATVVGCGTSKEPASSGTHEHSQQPSDGNDPSGHSHGTGPHDGTLADWGGGKYHVEITVAHDKQEATVYILGGDEKTPAPIPAENIQLSIQAPEMHTTLTAAPQDGDPEGSASRFIGNHESLGVVQEYAGTITGVVDGTPYSGDFKEEPHVAHHH